MKTRHAFLLLLAGAGMLLMSSCASLTGFQEARTLGEGNSEILVSLNLSQSPNFNDIEDEDGEELTDVPTLFFPNIEAAFNYGVAEKINVGVRLNTNLNIGIGAKFQLLGDQTTSNALAIGADVGTFGLIGGLWNVQIPLYYSFHPTEKFAWYLSPRYTYQFSSFTGAENGLSYMGGNTGLLFGTKHKFGVDIGYYQVGGFDESIGIFQVGVGGKFRF
ncbi:MAG: hypothetical protein J5I41_12265 [Saprospiraceae bacterium]|nr:hypothetical protein [Saprospiraceae bacterium]